MVDMIREYEQFIESKTSEKLGPSEREKLAVYHQEMVTNFQHERLIHLIVMFFFVAVGLILLAVLGYDLCIYGVIMEMIPFYALTLIVVVLSFFYVKHYYFLENHIQALYKYNKILRIDK